MQQSNQPTKIQLPFANSGQKNTIPVPSQSSTSPGAASYTDGFPSLTMQAISAGGIPPSGKDFNGILNAITAIQQWQSGGGQFTYDSAWSGANGGYPKGAVLVSADGSDLWLSLVDGNTTNPDATDGTSTNWASLAAYGIGAVTGLTNANVTLTPAQYSKRIITLAGALTGNVQVIVPNSQRDYTFVNQTTGAYTVTVKTAAGTGVVIPQGQLQSVYCDGTNINSLHAPATGNAAQIFKVANAAGANDAVALGQLVKMGGSISNGTGTTNTSTTVSFTAPQKGVIFIYAQGYHQNVQEQLAFSNLSNVNTIMSNSNYATSTIGMMNAVGTVNAGTITITATVSTSGAAGNCGISVAYIYIPTP